MPFIRPLENSIFNIFDPECIGFSHLNKHRFRHNYQECLNPLCTCSLETKNTCHHLLHGYHYTPFRIGLTDSIKTFVIDFDSLSDSRKVEIFFYGNSQSDDNKIVSFYKLY